MTNKVVKSDEYKVMSEKPIIFISHSSKDGDIADGLKTELESLFDNTIEIWHSSRDDSISAGDDWLERVGEQLDKADGLLVLVSRYSSVSEWVHWEIGYFEKKRRDFDKRLPLYVATIADEPLFKILDYQRTQAKSLSKVDSTSSLFNDVANQFNQNIDANLLQKSAETIVSMVRKQPYSDEDIGILRTYLKYEHDESTYITYQSLDGNKRFPPGFTKALLPQLAEETNWKLIRNKTDEYGTQLRKTGKSNVYQL